jgi:hypothetical protein
MMCRIFHPTSNKVMDLNCGSPANYTRIILWEAWGAPNQSWVLTMPRELPPSPIVAGGTYVLTNKQTGSAADFSQSTRRVRALFVTRELGYVFTRCAISIKAACLVDLGGLDGAQR